MSERAVVLVRRPADRPDQRLCSAFGGSPAGRRALSAGLSGSGGTRDACAQRCRKTLFLGSFARDLVADAACEVLDRGGGTILTEINGNFTQVFMNAGIGASGRLRHMDQSSWHTSRFSFVPVHAKSF